MPEMDHCICPIPMDSDSPNLNSGACNCCQGTSCWQFTTHKATRAHKTDEVNVRTVCAVSVAICVGVTLRFSTFQISPFSVVFYALFFYRICRPAHFGFPGRIWSPSHDPTATIIHPHLFLGTSDNISKADSDSHGSAAKVQSQWSAGSCVVPRYHPDWLWFLPSPTKPWYLASEFKSAGRFVASPLPMGKYSWGFKPNPAM